MALIKRPHGVKFKEPERFTPAEANLRRTQAMLRENERAWKRLEAGLSQAQTKLAQPSLAKQIVNDVSPKRQKAASIAAALKGFTERDFADEAKRKQYRLLRQAQLQSSQKVRPTGSDKRRYDPTGKDHASTIYGTAARISGVANIALGLRDTFNPVFLNPRNVVPCVQRSVRRQVMFAKNFAGVGYRVKHRRTWASEVPC